MKIKKGQVWIETVLYTLIGLALIGMVLGFAMPKITDAKDKAAIEQTIKSLDDFDGKMNTLLIPGNVRIYELTLKRGSLNFNLANNKVSFIIDDLRKPYSEPGVDIAAGRIIIRSEKGQKDSSVILTLNYDLDIVYGAGDENTGEKKFNPASIPYKFSMTNIGTGKIRIEEIA